MSYSLKELCKAADTTEGMVRYYISVGLLLPPISNGMSSYYGYEHRLRLQLLHRLKNEALSLTEIKNLLTGRSLSDLEEMARRPGLLGSKAANYEAFTELISEVTDLNLKNSHHPVTSLALLKDDTDLQASLKPGELASQPPAQAADPGNVETQELGSTAEILEKLAKARELLQEDLPLTPGTPYRVPPPPAPPASFSATPTFIPPPGFGRSRSGGRSAEIPPPPGIREFQAETAFIRREFSDMPPLPPEREELSGQTWERIVIAPGVELNIESSVVRRHRSALSLLVKEVRRLFKQ